MVDLKDLAKQGSVNVISIGYNTKCQNVITKSILYFEDGRYHLKNGGIVMYCDDTTDLYLDTKENRKILKSQLK